MPQGPRGISARRSHIAYIAHHIPGRMRLKVPSAKNRREVLEELRQMLLPLPGVSRVEANVKTGSVVIYYEREVHEHFEPHLTSHIDDIDWLSLVSPDEFAEAEEISEDVFRLSRHSRAAAQVAAFFGELNAEVRRATAGNLDLKVLVPLGSALYAFSKRSRRGTPEWLTLAIFAFNSFIRLHTLPPHPSQPTGGGVRELGLAERSRQSPRLPPAGGDLLGRRA